MKSRRQVVHVHWYLRLLYLPPAQGYEFEWGKPLQNGWWIQIPDDAHRVSRKVDFDRDSPSGLQTKQFSMV